MYPKRPESLGILPSSSPWDCNQTPWGRGQWAGPGGGAPSGLSHLVSNRMETMWEWYAVTNTYT
jgi:hypothetical protein